MAKYQRPLCVVSNPQLFSTPGPTGVFDSGDPTHPLLLRKLVGPADLSHDLAKKSFAKQKLDSRLERRTSPPVKPTVEGLYLYDSLFKPGDAEIFAKELIGVSTLQPISSWEMLAKTICQYSKIKQLVLSFHGFGGGLSIGRDARQLDQTSIKTLFSATGRPEVEDIQLFGCRIGDRPAKMAAFGRLFRARSISGYTWFLMWERITVTTPNARQTPDQNALKQAISEKLRPYRRFIIPDLVEEFRGAGSVMKFLVVYGAAQHKLAKFPLSEGNAKNYKPLREAKQLSVSQSKAESLEEELSSDPVCDFQRVVVDLSGE